MSELDGKIGRIEAHLEDIARTLEDIKDGKMAICQVHAQMIGESQKLLAKLTGNGNGGPWWTLQIGRLKAGALPAIIIAAGIAWGWYQHTLTKQVADEAKATTTSAVSDARTATRDEIRKMLAELREEIRFDDRAIGDGGEPVPAGRRRIVTGGRGTP